MSISRMLAAGFGLVGLVSPALAATEWSSFTERAQDRQLTFMGREGAAEEMRHESVSEEPGAGEATSFFARAESRQGIRPGRAMMGEAYAAVMLPTEATSFTDRAQMRQGMAAGPARAEDLSREQIRLVQRTLSAKGYRTDVTGRLDANTRSSLASFQRENSLPVSGTLDESTIEALGFDASQVRPVRGSEER